MPKPSTPRTFPANPENCYYPRQTGFIRGILHKLQDRIVMSSGGLTRELAKKILPHSAQEFYRTFRSALRVNCCRFRDQ
jgi:hypothetical protein